MRLSNNISRNFVIVVLVVAAAYLILEFMNGRAQMADFRVYYDAANAFIHDTTLYGQAFGVSSGFYKYSPFACLPFIPFAILPYELASILYYALIAFAIGWFMIRLVREMINSNLNPKKQILILVLISLFMADHLERELHLGNVNLFLLIGAFQIFISIKRNQFKTAGIIFGILLLFKPHFLILLPYFIWKQNWKLLMSALGMIVIGLLLPALFKGYDGNIQLIAEWIHAIRDHNVKLEESPNTMYGIVNHFLIAHTGGSWLIVLLLALTAGLFLYFLVRNKKLEENGKIRFIEYFVLIALIPNLAHTDTEHFMWTWPLIAYVIVRLVSSELKYKSVLIGMMLLAFIPYCLNSPDIVGKKMRFLFDEGGLLGVVNLVIIITAIAIYIQGSRKHQPILG